ncbi:hypothetical protein AVEN_51814-1 [Araneus ventricosus]|uniref:Uncharacterized protein n=1 Tax=Araneus ventricosus TaxID=182803 RepID=A0A4Y2GTY2_ARAVE|nr:hypothetical protein AVEN_51814-1 [Araneus ventricosus]
MCRSVRLFKMMPPHTMIPQPLYRCLSSTFFYIAYVSLSPDCNPSEITVSRNTDLISKEISARVRVSPTMMIAINGHTSPPAVIAEKSWVCL